MRKLLLYGLAAHVLLLGCATTRNLPTGPAEPPPTTALDSLPFVLVTPRASFLDHVLGRQAPVNYRGLPAKIKNSTVSVTYNHVAGHQVNTSTTTTTGKNSRTVVGEGASNTEAGKKAAPITQAAQGAAVHVASSRQGPAQAGDGNRATESGGWPWWLWLLIAVGVLAGCYKIYKRFTPT